MVKKWLKLVCPKEELQLKGTLDGGQSFRWKRIAKNQDAWIGVVQSNVFILKQEDDCILYQVHGELEENELKSSTFLRNYFQLSLNLKKCYTQWSETDPIFRRAASQFHGIRILNQDLTENIFSFICSSNNNISRISNMVEKLARLYGDKIAEIDAESHYSFPGTALLAAAGVEDTLKKEGFGYRAKYIHQSAKYIEENGGRKWLDGLEALEYKDAREKLMDLVGVGPKVADCICLMSLGHLGTIPVDTHVYQIARNFYLPGLRKQKTVTTPVYRQIGDHFRALYGEYAGWAHTVLFCADLKKFQNDESNK